MSAKTFNLHISDFDVNESFEETAMSLGLDRFEHDGADNLTITGSVAGHKNDDEKNITFYRGADIDDTTFDMILDTFKQPKNLQSITITVESAKLS